MSESVVVLGLGPVGATLALLLAHAGVPTIAIEREPDVFPLSRAIALDDEALRVLQAAGLAAPQAPTFLTQQTVRFRSRHGTALLDLPPRLSPNGHPALAFFHQPDLDRALREELRRHPNVTLLLGHELEALRQHGQGVALRLQERRTGSRRRIDAGWLLACDGARSLVRRELGISLQGLTSDRRWLVVDTHRPGGTVAGPFEFICDPARPTVTAPLPGARRRWEFMLLPGEEPSVMEQPEAVRALLAPFADADGLDVIRATVSTFHARVAERWRDGCIFLLGDAAHLSPPFAGQGLGAGLGDAQNLAWKIAAVVNGSASSALLDTYERERRPHVTRLIALAVLLGLAIQTRRPRLAVARDAALAAFLALPGARSWAAGGGWKPRTRYRHGFVRDGRWRPSLTSPLLPQPEVTRPGARGLPLDEVLGPRFALVGFETDPAAALDPESRAILHALSVQVVQIASHPAAVAATDRVTFVCDESGVLQEWFARAGGRLALVRPDRHVYALFGPEEAVRALREMAAAAGVLSIRRQPAPSFTPKAGTPRGGA
jgi:3-(3-hydroxy-phenyl)propionate hydroxylase